MKGVYVVFQYLYGFTQGGYSGEANDVTEVERRVCIMFGFNRIS